MKRLFLLAILCLTLILVGMVLAQTPESAFAEVGSLGQPRPRGMQYDPNFDQIVWVDALGRLELVDATTFEVQHTLYNSGFYNAYEFSHNGHYLALAIDIRFEIYDTQTGELLLTFEPDGALRAEGNLYWSQDDSLLGVNLQVRAPQAIRQSENDTTNLPYVWDIAAELGERRTILPGARAIPFFDFRNGFVYGSNNKAVVGLPERLQILDITPTGVEVISEIPSTRFERDPIFVWTSLRDDMMYIRPDPNSSQIIQLDTATGNQVTLPIGGDINAFGFDNLDGIQLSDYSRRIGAPLDTHENSLLRFFLGTDYRAQFGYHPITVTVVDYLDPATRDTGDRVAVLLYIFDETRGTGRFDLADFYPATGFSLSEDGNSIAVRRDSAESRIDVFDVTTGNLTQTFVHTLPEVAREGVFGFDSTGEIIISDFQHFDVSTGEIVFDNLHYNNGYDRFFWDDASDKLVTVSGSRWWVWDIYTGEVVRQESLTLGETIIGTAYNGERYLISLIDTQNEFGMASTYEMVEVGMDDRIRVSFADLPQVTIENIIFSPGGENYLVIYSVNSRGQHAPGNEIMLYNIDAGALLHVAGDDLPYMTNRQYGWLDDETIYIYSEEGTASPERVYGLEYHGSGVPQCLADEYPEHISEWSLIWERLNYNLRSDDLNNLAQATCDLLPVEQEEIVIDFIFPSATPTRLPVTATPSTIAGVPLCLTNRFSVEARDYAEIWQELIAGKTDAEIEELEILLCENITGSGSPQGEAAIVTNNVEVMTININTGIREVGAYIPDREIPLDPNLDLIYRAFRQQYGFTPDGELSPDLNFLAVRTQRNHVNIYRLLTPYETYAQNATATVMIQEEAEEEDTYLSLRPTATQGFQYLGEPRPTFTPTVTPTTPPLPDGDVYLSQNEEVERICPFRERFTLENPPPDFAATGRILTTNQGVLTISTGDYIFQDELPRCLTDQNCNFSPDRNWIFYQNDTPELIISRPDGSQASVLAYDNQLAFGEYSGFRWQGSLIAYNVEIPASNEQRRPRIVTYLYNPETGDISDAPIYESRESYNQLPTNGQSTQPGQVQRYQVATVTFTTSVDEGLRFFIYDYVDEEYIYFARSPEVNLNGAMSFEWHPQGEFLFYSYPGDENTYAFNTATEEFTLYGDIAPGRWSRDGAAKVYETSVSQQEREDLIEAGEPVPHITVWNANTGLRTEYCVPGFEEEIISSEFMWSPDNRYITFRSVLPDERGLPDAPVRTFILDTQTGSITEISDLAPSPIVWLEEVYR